MKKQHLFEHGLFSAIFDTQQSKDDFICVIVTSFRICLLLILRNFVPYYYHAKFGGNRTSNKGEMEGAECPPPPPPAYMVPPG